MYFAIATRATLSPSLNPHANIRSSWSCSSLVKFGPTAAARRAMHWNMGSSGGVYFSFNVSDGSIIEEDADEGSRKADEDDGRGSDDL